MDIKLRVALVLVGERNQLRSLLFSFAQLIYDIGAKHTTSKVLDFQIFVDYSFKTRGKVSSKDLISLSYYYLVLSLKLFSDLI